MFTMQNILLIFFAIIFVVNGSDYENFWGGYGFNHKDTTRYVRNERIADITRKWCEDDTVPSTMADLFMKMTDCSGVPSSVHDLFTGTDSRESILTANMKGEPPSGTVIYTKNRWRIC